VHFVGRDNFYAAAREYFRQHAFGTATFDDLIAALANHTDQDLHDWSKRWLRTSGPDQLIPEVTTSGNTIKQLSIVQNGSPQTRPHRLTVSLFRGAPLERYHSMDVRLPGIPGKNTELTEAHGLPAPDLILLNDNDHTYAKIGFDPTSLHTIKARLGNITDNMSRAVIWTALWNLTRDAELPAQDYIDIVMLHGANEPNPSIIEQVFANAYVAATKFTTDPTVIADLVYSLWDLMYQAKPGSDTQLVLVRAAITALAADRKPGSARKLRELLGGHLAGLVLSPDIRWRIIAALASHDDVTAQELLAEREADNTLDGQAAYLQAMYSYPHAKQQAFDDLLHAMDYSNEEVNALIAGFRAPTDPRPGAPDFAAEFFANLRIPNRNRQPDRARPLPGNRRGRGQNRRNPGDGTARRAASGAVRVQGSGAAAVGCPGIQQLRLLAASPAGSGASTRRHRLAAASGLPSSMMVSRLRAACSRCRRMSSPAASLL